MNEYIGPAYQLPQKAQSLHVVEDLLEHWSIAIRQFWKAFEPVVETFKQVFTQVSTRITDALKHIWRYISQPRRTTKPSRNKYQVPFRPRKVNRKRAMIAQRKMIERYV